MPHAVRGKATTPIIDMARIPMRVLVTCLAICLRSSVLLSEFEGGAELRLLLEGCVTSVGHKETCRFFGIVPASIVELGRDRVSVPGAFCTSSSCAPFSSAVVMNVARMDSAD